MRRRKQSEGYDPYNSIETQGNFFLYQMKRASQGHAPLKEYSLDVSTSVAEMLSTMVELPEWYKEKLRRSLLYGKFITPRPRTNR